MSEELDHKMLAQLRGTNRLLARFRHYRADEDLSQPAFRAHEDHRYAFIDHDDVTFAKVLDRFNREFGDPTKDLGGPEMPAAPSEDVARRARKERRRG